LYTFTTAAIPLKGTRYYIPGKDKTCVVTLTTGLDGKQDLFHQIGKAIRPIGALMPSQCRPAESAGMPGGKG
jgi:hypothetical protein